MIISSNSLFKQQLTSKDTNLSCSCAHRVHSYPPLNPGSVAPVRDVLKNVNDIQNAQIQNTHLYHIG